MASAISAGSANREIGPVTSAIFSFGMEAVIRVAAFGEIAFTVTPKAASSFAAVLVNPMIPAFAVA